MAERELLFKVTADDCNWQYYRASGKGGQKRNKTSSAVRCTHKASGAVGAASDERSQRLNRQTAFRRMSTTKEFQVWLKLESARRMGAVRDVAARVDEAMRQENLMVEVKDEEGKWSEAQEEIA